MEDYDFASELASFLAQMSYETFDDATAKVRKAGTTVREIRDTTDPHYITVLLTGILRGAGEVANVNRTTKHLSDEIRWYDSYAPWRRSPLWLVTRVALQTTLREGDSHLDYKSFIAFLLAKILQLAVDFELPSDTLHIMHAKLAKRIHKLQGALNPALSQLLHAAGDKSKELRSRRWERVQEEHARSPHWAPETLDLIRDTELTLKNSRKYIDAIRSDGAHVGPLPPFKPAEAPRFLAPSVQSKDFGSGSSKLEAALAAECFAGLRDFEESITLYLHEWVTQKIRNASITPEHFNSLAEFFSTYYKAASKAYKSNVEDQSTMLLTLFEIWMAIDRLAIAEIPLMAKYIPEVTDDLLEPLILPSSRFVRQAAKIMKYCRERKSAASLGTVFSNNIDANSIGVRYFRSSQELTDLKLQIEANAELIRNERRKQLVELNRTHRELRTKAGMLSSPLRSCVSRELSLCQKTL